MTHQQPTKTEKHLRESLAALPTEPGVYLMKDHRGDIIYVGKAKDLRARVTSYFTQRDQTPKTRTLVSEIRDFNIILVQTEVEALLLERTLIKHHQPRFNILLRDDKEYPYIRIDYAAAWPRIEKVRKRRDDGATYLGPYGNPGFLRVLLDASQRIFPQIRCSSHEFANAKRPCNYYHMKMCLAPCTLPVDRDVYIEMMRNVVAFLQGKNREVAKSLRSKMQESAEREEFEKAAVFRDQLLAFDAVAEKQAVINIGIEDADFIGFVANDRFISLQVLMVRSGKLLGTDSFLVSAGTANEDETLTHFMLQYYDGRSVPPTIFLPLGDFDLAAMSQALAGDSPPQLIIPQRGPKRELIDTAERNARFALEEADRKSERQRVELEILREKLALAAIPKRIECIDISNLQGTAIVASNVCFIDGKPAKDHYRHYAIKNLVHGSPDDFESIREVVFRRLTRAGESDDWPDLLVIDGGKGQLAAALEARSKYIAGLQSKTNEQDVQSARARQLTIVSLAKSRAEKERFPEHKDANRFVSSSTQKRSFERVFIPGMDTPLALAPGSPEYRILTHLRDEAHRFAITHHRKKRAKVLQGSSLEDIPGIGKTLRMRLIKDFGGLEGLKRASLDALRKVRGLKEDAAVALYSYLHSDEPSPPKDEISE